ncbi:MAG: ATP-binding cassette domain-containing protein, partial [Planctomycetes bacterium]|nr:ATP-binding cassette domain-containing protein [Planctomycetota bacterium]
KKNRLHRVTQLLEEVGLKDHAQQKAKSLSGGEKRRLEIARLLLEDPKILLLDEPFAGLDPRAIRLLKTHLSKLHQRGIHLIISDHQVTHILELCQEIVLLQNGEKLLHCSSEEFSQHPLAKEHYL